MTRSKSRLHHGAHNVEPLSTALHSFTPARQELMHSASASLLLPSSSSSFPSVSSLVHRPLLQRESDSQCLSTTISSISDQHPRRKCSIAKAREEEEEDSCIPLNHNDHFSQQRSARPTMSLIRRIELEDAANAHGNDLYNEPLYGNESSYQYADRVSLAKPLHRDLVSPRKHHLTNPVKKNPLTNPFKKNFLKKNLLTNPLSGSYRIFSRRANQTHVLPRDDSLATAFEYSSESFTKVDSRATLGRSCHSVSSQFPKDSPSSVSSVVAVRWRLFVLTLYCCAHCYLLTIGFWDSSYFDCSSTSPSSTELLPSGRPMSDHHRMQQFLSLAHPHVDSHPHLHVPLTTAMERGLVVAAVEWVFVFVLSSSSLITPTLRSSLFGLIVSLLLFVQITGVLYGGLYFKTPLFPDLWSFIFQLLEVNYLDRYCLTIPARRLNSVPSSNWKIAERIIRCPIPLSLVPSPSSSSTLTNVLSLMGSPLRLMKEKMAIFLYLLDIIGVLMSCIAVKRFLKLKLLLLPAVVFVGALAIANHYLSGLPLPDSNDYHWINFTASQTNTQFFKPSSLTPPVCITKYIPMSDGVSLAVDVYLPEPIVLSMIDQMESNSVKRFYAKGLGIQKSIADEYKNHHRLDAGGDADGGSGDAEHIQDRYRYKNDSRHTVNAAAARSPVASSLHRSVAIPTLLIVTRYNRRMTVKWPFTLLSLWGAKRGSSTSNVWSWQFVDTFLPHDFAVVIVDARGTGASFGSRPIDFHPLELHDLSEVYHWVKNQFWSDGKISTGGFSYDGMAALHLAAREQVDAVLALFTPIDVVHDLIQPGGLVCSTFVDHYFQLTHSFETFGSPGPHMLKEWKGFEWQLVVGFVIVFGMPAPVKGMESLLPIAITAHQSNWNMSRMVEAVDFADDLIWVPAPSSVSLEQQLYSNTSNDSSKGTEKLRVGDFGITHKIADAIRRSQASVYIVGGYCDSSSVRGAARLFEFLRHSPRDLNSSSSREVPSTPHQLILGPWTHTGRRNCHSTGTWPQFESEMYFDMLRFLNCKMKNRCWNDESPLMDSAVDPTKDPSIKSNRPDQGRQELRNKTTSFFPVHFWSVVEDRWLSDHFFPPVNVQALNLWLMRNSNNDDHSEQQDQEQQHFIATTDSLDLRVSEPSLKRLLTERMQEHSLHHLHPSSSLKSSFFKDGQHQHQQQHQQQHQRQQHDQQQQQHDPIVRYLVDYTATTSGVSRWSITKHPFRMATSFLIDAASKPPSDKSIVASVVNSFHNFVWPWWNKKPREPKKDRRQPTQDRRLYFMSPVLHTPIRIVGSPLLRLSLNLTDEFQRYSKALHRENRNVGFSSSVLNHQMQSSALEVTIFGYLEDYDPITDTAQYITEGRALLSHRPTVASNATSINGLEDWSQCIKPPFMETDNGFDQGDNNHHLPSLRQASRIGTADLVYQSGKSLDHQFSRGGVECLVFTFEPCAWYFESGHSIRLNLAGADEANFRWEMQHTSTERQAPRVKRPQTWEILPGGFLQLPVYTI